MGLFDGISDAISGAFDSATESLGNFTDGFALGDIAAPLIGAAGSYLGSTSANQANKDLARQANEFTAQQYAQRYQTTVKDLKAAGLNPMLAYSQLGGGSPSSVAPPRMENAIGNAVHSGIQAAQASNAVLQNNLLRAQTQKTDTEADNIQADTVNKLDQNPNIKLENKRMLADIAFKDTAAQLNSATKGLQEATTKNVRENIAPSVDPYWYRDAKKHLNSAKDFLQLKHLEGIRK